MAKGLPGADSSQPVTTAMIQAATDLFGQKPSFWGRYFTGPATGGSVEYHHANESPVLAEAGIRLLPVARQTAHVAGTEAEGTADAQANVSDFFATFPQTLLVSQGGQFLMFLDVEGLPQAGSPSLSLDYYTGWAQTLTNYSRNQSDNTVTILPCIYARQGDNVTWDVLATANIYGIPCSGAWVARYYNPSCELNDWNGEVAIPSVTLPCDVLIWQYAANCCNGTIDSNQTNPNIDIQAGLLSKLVLPSSGS